MGNGLFNQTSISNWLFDVIWGNRYVLLSLPENKTKLLFSQGRSHSPKKKTQQNIPMILGTEKKLRRITPMIFFPKDNEFGKAKLATRKKKQPDTFCYTGLVNRDP